MRGRGGTRRGVFNGEIAVPAVIVFERRGRRGGGAARPGSSGRQGADRCDGARRGQPGLDCPLPARRFCGARFPLAPPAPWRPASSGTRAADIRNRLSFATATHRWLQHPVSAPRVPRVPQWRAVCRGMPVGQSRLRGPGTVST